MEPFQLPSDEEIGAAYDEGKEAVILVHNTPKRLEIITGRRVIFCRFLATEEKEKTEEKEERLHKS